VIVVTGADGSIGKALLAAVPSAVGIDIGDWDITQPRRNEIEAQPTLVFHLAASKDAPSGERDPEHVARVNVLGTQNVLDRWPDATVIMASTCKACDPETAYGASKLIAERMVLNRGGSVARFHNVIETSGNVFAQWRAIPGPESLPVTSCHRYFIHLEDAIFLLQAVALMEPGRYLLHPGRARWMPDMVKEYHPGRRWHYIDARRGDRIREPLVATHEKTAPTEVDGILRVTSYHD
jgi:FlaA1/EpsC-like NDP-sugar epimerase